ncbi:MAG: hypothetical protein JNK63_04505 [Chthonomonas sp.]|nr:hypothetical protein [Chthonomonas sp.]
MTGATLRRITVWLCIALSFTTLLVVLGRTANEVMPSVTSSKPSGIRLAGDILESNGFKVRQDLNQSPQIGTDELIVAFVVADRRWGNPWGGGSRIRLNLKKAVASGRNLVLIRLGPDFNLASRAAVVDTFNRSFARSKPYNVHANLDSVDGLGSGLGDGEPINVWIGGKSNSALVSYESLGSGVIAQVHDGVAFTNRFIDQADNAAFFATLISSMAGTNRKVVFTEASFGNISDEGMISALGGWARASVWQGYLLFGVIAWTSAITFGLPYARRRRQAGVRDLMEALAKMLGRTKSNRMAQGLMVSALRRDLLRLASLPAKATDSQLEARLAPELMSDLIAARGDISHPSTLAAISRLRKAISEHRSAK